MPMPASRTVTSTASPSQRGAHRDRLARLASTSPRCRAGWRSRCTTCRPSHATSAPVTPGCDLEVDPGRDRGRPQLLDRVVDEHLERHRRRATAPPASRSGSGRAGRRRCGPRRSASLHHPLGERTRHRRVVLRGERLGQHLQRADRRLQLVAHVGHEVAAHALDAVHLGDVGDERGHSQRPLGVAERHGRADAPRPGGAEELQLAFAASPSSARRDERVERAGDDRVGVPRLAGSAPPPGCGTPRGRRHRARPPPWRELVEHGQRSGRAARRRLSVSPSACGERLLQRRRRRCSRRCGLMAASAEPPGDVTLGASVGRAR